MAETLPRVLKARGMTQDQLAEATGINRTDINALAKGRIDAGPDRLQRIADALRVSPVELGALPTEEDPAGQLLHHRQDELEAEVRRLTAQVRRLASQARALERRLQRAGIG